MYTKKIKYIDLFIVSAELQMDVLRERQVKDNLERQLQDEQKARGERYYYFFYS